MAKIEEITALLTEEISLFEKSVNELKRQQELLSSKKIEIDTTAFELRIKENISAHEQINFLHLNEVKILNKKITKTFTIPKWVLIGNFTLIGLLLASISFNIYLDKNIKEREKIAFQEGINYFKEHVREFFRENPSSLNKYQAWDEKQ